MRVALFLCFYLLVFVSIYMVTARGTKYSETRIMGRSVFGHKCYWMLAEQLPRTDRLIHTKGDNYPCLFRWNIIGGKVNYLDVSRCVSSFCLFSRLSNVREITRIGKTDYWSWQFRAIVSAAVQRRVAGNSAKEWILPKVTHGKVLCRPHERMLKILDFRFSDFRWLMEYSVSE